MHELQYWCIAAIGRRLTPLIAADATMPERVIATIKRRRTL